MISVIIPLYNKEKRIGITIKSVLMQSYNDFEVVIVDDGSTDRGPEIVLSFNDVRIHLIKQSNGGPSKARNTGMKAALGEWVLLLDADDELLPNALQTFKELTEKYPEEKCFACNFYSVKNGARKIYSPFYWERIVKHPHWAWSFHNLFPRTGAALFHHDVVEHYQFRNNLRRYEDAEWLFRIMRSFYFVRSPKPVMLYNLDSAEASARRDNISEDFLGHLEFNHETIGENLAVYQLYLKALKLYPEESNMLYRNKLFWYEERLLLILCQISKLISKILSVLRVILY